jgi:hypothetical protein
MRYKTEFNYTEKNGSVHRVTDIVEDQYGVQNVFDIVLGDINKRKININNVTRISVVALPTKLKLSKKTK